MRACVILAPHPTLNQRADFRAPCAAERLAGGPGCDEVNWHPAQHSDEAFDLLRIGQIEFQRGAREIVAMGLKCPRIVVHSQNHLVASEFQAVAEPTASAEEIHGPGLLLP